ncbi:MAG: hypothetical protein HKM03_01015 [Steroidobacteraceae bacterium]|jgi:hypothetical protein|nr:hypothetical protein [Steroidobacteraceae bacterium]
MKAAIHDADTLRGLKPLEVVQYLRAKGWQQEGDLGSKATLWVTGGDTDDEIILPMRRELGDFDLRMSEVLRTLEKVEARSQLDILRDLQAASSDLIRIRAPTGNTADGTIPIEAAVTFVERARDLMLAAACAAIDKRSYFATRKPSQATDYLDQVRMGQTERGSFVLTILSPVTPLLKPADTGSLFPAEPPEPFERSVTRTLALSLAAVRAAADMAAAQGNPKAFIDAVGQGVSANLCEALVGLAQISPSDGLDIGISWSPNRAIAASTPQRVTLPADTIPLLKEAARLFRETGPVEDFELQGGVVGLSRPEGTAIGRVTVAGFIEGRARKVLLDLVEPDYTTAIRAHEEEAIVLCTGELVKEGRSFRLQNPRRFRMLGDSET